MIFTCYRVTDGHPYNGKTIGWAVVGNGTSFLAGFLTTAQDKARKAFPDVKLKFQEEEGFSILEGEEKILAFGRDVHAAWERDGRPDGAALRVVDGKLTW